MYKFIDLTIPNNIKFLQDFLEILDEDSLKTFRYFKNRNLEIVKTHLVSVILCNEFNESIGYAHLEKENNTIWLGICIATKFQGKGFGSMLIDYLINQAKIRSIDSIALSVDTTNYAGQKLYEKNNFTVSQKFETKIIYTLKLNND